MIFVKSGELFGFSTRMRNRLRAVESWATEGALESTPTSPALDVPRRNLRRESSVFIILSFQKSGDEPIAGGMRPAPRPAALGADSSQT
jgi:hypothetical protein